MKNKTTRILVTRAVEGSTEIFSFTVESPYSSSTQLYPKKAAAWRSLQGTGSACLENAAVKNPRQMWLGSLKQGIGIEMFAFMNKIHCCGQLNI